jgi:PPOX class probable F420-dependent enzyme
MKLEEAILFLEKNHRGVVGTRRPNGSVHSSIVVCGVYKGKGAFVSVYPKSQKIKNLRRDPKCTLLSVTEDWKEYVVIEGGSELLDYNNTEPHILRPLLRDVYMACSETQHPNWNKYDQAMVTQKAVIVTIQPEKVYGLLRSKQVGQ